MRPTSLDEVAGQGHLLRPGSPLVTLANPEAAARAATSVILWGPPGTGKTTLAQAIARSSGRRFVELSAVTAGVKDVREVMQEALTQRDLYGQSTILFLDEIHRFTKAQQDALLPGVENGWVVLIAATTENPSFSVISPLLSRSLLLTLKPLTDDDLRLLIDRALVDARGLAGAVALTDEARDALVRLSSGDARRALTALEAAASFAEPADDEAESADDEAEPPEGGSEPPRITPEHVAQAVDRALLRYDRQGDEHYDVISAFIKSIRGSDVDAAMHYLARMIEAGEDPRFIARRLIISAAEDIGLARRRRTSPPQRSRTPPTSRSTRRSPTCGPAASAGCRCTCATRTTRARSGSATARGTCTRTTPRSASRRSSIFPTSCAGAATTSPPATGRSGMCRHGSRRSGAFSQGSAEAQHPACSSAQPRLINLTGSKHSFRASSLFFTDLPACPGVHPDRAKRPRYVREP